MKSSLLSIIFSRLLVIFILLPGLSLADTHRVEDQRIQELLGQFRENSKAPAAVLSINFPDNRILNDVSGTVTRVSPKNLHPPQITADYLFQIGSITKSFTAVIILQLEAEGKLAINDSIEALTQRYGSWLPEKEYEAWKNITLKQLLNMTSGIFDVTEDKNFMKMLAAHPEKNWTPEEIIKYAYQHKPYFQPGKGWHYSNGAYNILGILIEKVTQHSFEKEINKRLLRKYNLTHTFYLPYKYPQCIMSRMAHGYVYQGGGFSPPMRSGNDATGFNLSAAGPSGALVSNSSDISKWVRLLFSNKLLPVAQMNELLTAVCVADNQSCQAGETLPAASHSQGFSLGLLRMYDPQLGQIWAYHGDTPGYSSGFIWLPKQKIALAMTSSSTSKHASKLLKNLAQIAIEGKI